VTPEQYQAALDGLGIRFTAIQTRQLISPDDPRSELRSSIEMREGLILAGWAQGARVLEIGTGLGVSTVCLAHEATEVVTVDPDPWVRSALCLPSHVLQLECFEQVQGPFDFAFIDGLHDRASVTQDIQNCLQIVKFGGHIAFHDVNQPEVRDAVGAFPWLSREAMSTIGQLTRCGVPFREEAR
jgi:Predicted O-methyltransferase